MKRIGLLLLAVVLVVGLAGCPGGGGNRDADPVGTWVTTYDWSCNGSTGLMTWHVYATGTFASSEGDGGIWSVNKNDFTLAYTTAGSDAVYLGAVDNDRMAGTMSSPGSTGCWSAQRTSTTP